MNLQTGAFGDPTNIKTLILFWTKMELLHYPGAGETRRYLEEELQKEEERTAMQPEQQMAMEASQGAMQPMPMEQQQQIPLSPSDGIEPGILEAVLGQAQRDALAAAEQGAVDR